MTPMRNLRPPTASSADSERVTRLCCAHVVQWRIVSAAGAT